MENRSTDEQMRSLLLVCLRSRAEGRPHRAAQLRLIRRLKRSLSTAATATRWNMLGDAYIMPHKRRDCYRHALWVDRNNVEAAYELAYIEFYVYGRVAEAERLVRVFQNRLPVGAEYSALTLIAAIHDARGRSSEAQRAIGLAARWIQTERGVRLQDLDPGAPEGLAARYLRSLRTTQDQRT